MYQGGLKIWECSYDLSHYIFENNVEFQDKVVLDLGCGAGIIGLIAVLKNSTVHFQDYVRVVEIAFPMIFTKLCVLTNCFAEHRSN